MTCFTEMMKALNSNPIKRSPHQETNCRFCKEDATKYHHCAWCGATFTSFIELVTHMDGQLKARS